MRRLTSSPILVSLRAFLVSYHVAPGKYGLMVPDKSKALEVSTLRKHTQERRAALALRNCVQPF